MNQPILFQRIEGAMLLSVAVVLYQGSEYSWLMFALLLLVFDVSMAGYLFNKKIGAWLYNAGHSLVIPVPGAIYGLLHERTLLVAVCLIWIAHIGADRLLGYGLKYDTAFSDTHLGTIGKSKSN